MTKQVVIAHSPDSDDAYMMAPLALGWLEDDADFRRFSFEFVRKDIELLNCEALEARYDVTAISFGVYPEIADKYDLLRAGSSIQEGTGPLVVARESLRPEDLLCKIVAIPGLRTSAYLAMRQWMPGLKTELVPFDRIMDEVADGNFDAGLLIHESQLMYKDRGLNLVADLGDWWKKQRDLPLPMGGNAIRKDMPPEEKQAFARLMRKSVETAMARHQESIDYAQSFGRGMNREMVDRYVRAWVNDFTIDVGDRGERAVYALLGGQVVWVDC
jgi:1,4-dihydroxy-6-naphthoate synthase